MQGFHLNLLAIYFMRLRKHFLHACQQCTIGEDSRKEVLYLSMIAGGGVQSQGLIPDADE